MIKFLISFFVIAISQLILGNLCSTFLVDERHIAGLRTLLIAGVLIGVLLEALLSRA